MFKYRVILIGIGFIFWYLIMFSISFILYFLPLTAHFMANEINQAYFFYLPIHIWFAYWIVIYIALFFLSVYYFLFSIKDGQTEDEISLKFAIYMLFVCIAHILWIILRINDLKLLAIIINFFLLIVLIRIYYLLNIDYAFETKNHIDYEYNYVEVPVSLYLAWSTIIAFSSVTEYLEESNWSRFGLTEVIWRDIIIVCIFLIAAVSIYIRKDGIFLTGILWCLFGFFIQNIQNNNPIDPSSLTKDIILAKSLKYSAIFILILIIFKIVSKSYEKKFFINNHQKSLDR